MGAKLKYILGPPTTLYEPNTYIPDMSLTLKYVRVHSMADPRVAAKSGVLSKNDLKLIQVKTRSKGTHFEGTIGFNTSHFLKWIWSHVDIKENL